jgi:hypothetical protein
MDHHANAIRCHMVVWSDCRQQGVAALGNPSAKSPGSGLCGAANGHAFNEIMRHHSEKTWSFEPASVVKVCA